MKDRNPPPEKIPSARNPKAEWLYRQGASFLDSAHLEPAKVYLERALEGYASKPDPPRVALCYLKLGRAVELLGEYERAKNIYRRSLELHEGLKDISGVAKSKAFLGNVAWAQGDYPEAAKLLQEALAHFKEANDLPGQVWVTDMQANLNLAQGNHQEAERLHQTAIALAHPSCETPLSCAWNDYHLAAIDLFRQRRKEAREGFLRALKAFTRLKDVLGVVATCSHLCGIASEDKDFASAEKYILRSLKLVIPTQCRPLLVDAMTSLARLLLGRGQNDKALGMLMFVLSHPTCRQQTKDEMKSLAKVMEARFSSKEFESGFDWAKHIPLEEMAVAWVKTLSAKSK
jgi:tetratricopeptide (TPR) repeat protein